MKEKLLGRFGTLGIVIYYLVSLILSVLPLVMIDAAFWVKLILLAVMQFLPVTSIAFWIWGLVCTIRGPQDFLAIIYYVAFAIMFIPIYVNIVLDIAEAIRK